MLIFPLIISYLRKHVKPGRVFMDDGQPENLYCKRFLKIAGD